MKKLLWTSALALTAMACLTACGDDSSTSAGGDDNLYSCDITAKKVVVKQNAGEYSVTQTYTHNEDGTMTSRYEYGPGHKNVCDGPMPTEVDDEDAEMTCKDNVLTVKTKETVTTGEFQGYAGAATAVCPEPASWGKDTKPSDDDDDEGGSTVVDDDEGGSTVVDDDDDEGPGNGGDANYTCNFEKSDDTWTITDGEGGGEMIVKWGTGKAVTVTKIDMDDAENCQLTLSLLALDTEDGSTSSCDGAFLLMEDPDIYKDVSKDELYDVYCK